jgi:hypothetical protein
MNKMQELEAKIAFMNGQIDILFGFISSVTGKEKFIEYLKFVSKNEEIYKNTRDVAQALLDHDKMWSFEWHSKPI